MGGLLRPPHYATNNCIFKMTRIKPCCIAFLVYPDVSDHTGIQALEQIRKVFYINGLTGFVSPLHHEGKYHFHVEIIRPARCGFTMDTYREICNCMGGANEHIEVIYKPQEYARYLCHRGYPDKEQFQGIKAYEFGIDYDSYIKSNQCYNKIKEDETEILKDIIAWCNEYCIFHFTDIVDFSLEKSPNWFPIIKKNTNFLKTYLRSLEYQVNVRKQIEKRRI